jgi:5-formyltetrahydrofolate cyclo-ligase
VNKKDWRDRLSSLKARLSDQEWEQESWEIHKRLISHPLWKESTHITMYYSVDKEVDTLSLIREGWAAGKKIYLPKCDSKSKTLTFYQVESFDQLEVVYYGIPEPKPTECHELNRGNLDAIIVPGLAFDLQGYRIGYGGGYYDRFLSSLSRRAVTLSLAFPFQLVEEELPREEYDIPVDIILTSQQCISCAELRD